MTDTPPGVPKPKRTSAERREFLAQAVRARDLPDIFLDCRLLRHAWQECEPDRPSSFGELHVYQCLRCLSIRDVQTSTQFSEVLASGYRYAPGYMVAKPEDGTRTFSAAALRAERRRRRLEGNLTYPAVRQWDETLITKPKNGKKAS